MQLQRLLHAAPWLCLLALGPTPAAAADAPKVKVAGIVLKWVRGDREANFRRAVPLIRQAAEKGARIVCTTECFLDGYAIADKSIPLETYRALGEPIPGGKYYRRLAELARQLKIHLVAGLLEADGEARYNTAVLIGPDGKLAGKYRKQKLGHESVRNTAGRLAGACTPYGKCQVMICADRTDAELVRGLLIAGRFPDLSLGGSSARRATTRRPARRVENKVPTQVIHPAEFLVTGPTARVLDRTSLGDTLLVPPEQIGKEKDKTGSS
jgi:hypothetical protein